MNNKKKLLNKQIGNKITDMILLVVIFGIITIAPPLILYTYLITYPIQESLNCKGSICQYNQLNLPYGHFTLEIKRPTNLQIESSIGRNFGIYYFLKARDDNFRFKTSYHFYKAIESDKTLIESSMENIKIRKNNTSLFFPILLNLIDICFIIYCIRFWSKK